MTDNELRIAIAKAKGWTHCEASFGRVVGYAPDNDGTPSDIPDYPGDPCEWAELLQQMATDVVSIIPVTPIHWRVLFIAGFMGQQVSQSQNAPTLGRAVCLAWLAWHTARSGEGE